jgi:hypothetical protein
MYAWSPFIKKSLPIRKVLGGVSRGADGDRLICRLHHPGVAVHHGSMLSFFMNMFLFIFSFT